MKLRRRRLSPAVLFANLIFAVVVNTATASGADAPDALTNVLQKYAQALGGLQRISGIRTVESVYTSTLMGRNVTVTTIAKAPFFFTQRIRVADSPVSLAIGFDGKTAWEKTITGEVQTLTGQKRAEIVNQAAALNNSEIIPGRWSTQLALKPSETVDGKTYFVLSVRPQEGSAHDLLIDSQTFLPVISRDYEGQTVTINVVKSFGRGPLGEETGALVVTTRSDGSLPDVVSKLVSTRDNVPVSDSIFAPPVPTNAPTSNV